MKKGEKMTAEIKEKLSEARLRGIARGTVSQPWNKGLKALENPKLAEVGRKISKTKILRGPTPAQLAHLREMSDNNVGNKYRMGQKPGNWIEDRTKIVTRQSRAFKDSNYKQWCSGVKNRDGWKCRIANSSCSGRMEAHHILGWKSHPNLRYELNNGITLCHFHHPRSRQKEMELSPYFQELVLKGN